MLVALGIPAAIFAESVQSENSSGLKNAVILIIRHAEKAGDGHGLSSLGVERAKAYASYFKNFTIDGRAVKLDEIFGSKDSRTSHRPLLTIEPTAEELGLKINDLFKNNHFNELVNEIKSQPHGENILVVWHHGNIPGLLRSLVGVSCAASPVLFGTMEIFPGYFARSAQIRKRSFPTANGQVTSTTGLLNCATTRMVICLKASASNHSDAVK